MSEDGQNATPQSDRIRIVSDALLAAIERAASDGAFISEGYGDQRAVMIDGTIRLDLVAELLLASLEDRAEPEA